MTRPEPGDSTEPLDRILLGMHDYYSGLDMDQLTLVADFEIDGIPAGQDLSSKLRALPDSRWELKLGKPIAAMDREGTHRFCPRPPGKHKSHRPHLPHSLRRALKRDRA